MTASICGCVARSLPHTSGCTKLPRKLSSKFHTETDDLQEKTVCIFPSLPSKRQGLSAHTFMQQAGEPPTTQSPRNYSLNYSPDQEASKIPSHVKTTYLLTPHSCPSLQVVGEATSCTCRGGYECKLNSFSLAKYHHQPASHSPGHWS